MDQLFQPSQFKWQFLILEQFIRNCLLKNVKLNNYERLSTVHTFSLFFFLSLVSRQFFVLSTPVEFVYETPLPRVAITRF